MSRRTLLGLAAMLALSAFAAEAGEKTSKPLGVVELFTSQGCSSCPPADQLLADLVERDDVIALAYHVDYWDYLGWRDTLSSPENTARQYDYMRAFGIRSVYTPQAVINGGRHVNGANRTALMDALEKSGPLSVPLSVTHSGESLVVEAGAASGAVGKAHLILVYFEAPHRIEIAKGENKGRTVTYWNAVSGRQTVGMWHGEAARYEFPMREIAQEAGSAVLLQAVGSDGSPKSILGAAIIRRPHNR